MPVYADNGAKTLAAAESWFGAARGARHAIVALIGRGIGAGVIAGGRVLRGYASSAGGWGHTKVAIDGPACHCGGRGCLEACVFGDDAVALGAALLPLDRLIEGDTPAPKAST